MPPSVTLLSTTAQHADYVHQQHAKLQLTQLNAQGSLHSGGVPWVLLLLLGRVRHGPFPLLYLHHPTMSVTLRCHTELISSAKSRSAAHLLLTVHPLLLVIGLLVEVSQSISCQHYLQESKMLQNQLFISSSLAT